MSCRTEGVEGLLTNFIKWFIVNCVGGQSAFSLPFSDSIISKKWSCQDHLVASLSEEQKQQRLRIVACNDSNTPKQLCKLRTCILRLLNSCQREVACQKDDQLARDIASTNDSCQMFKAVQSIKPTKRPPPLTVHTKDGKCIGTDQGKTNAISEWFVQQFSDQSDE